MLPRDIVERIRPLLSDVEGCVVECGVRSGRSLFLLADMIQREGRGRSLYGFDAWSPEEFPSVTYEAALAAIEEVWRRQRLSIRPILIQGWFSETLARTETGVIALLHADADLYCSHMDIYSHLEPRMALGGIILVDDYGEREWPGVQLATDNFFPPGQVEAELHGHHRIISVGRRG